MVAKKSVKKGTKKTPPRKRNPKKKSKTIMERLRTASKVWDTLKMATKIALAVVTLGAGVYVYRQFHKSPEKVEEEVTEMKKETREKMEKSVEKVVGTNKSSRVISRVAGKLTEIGASWGGAHRKWVNEKLRKNND